VIWFTPQPITWFEKILGFRVIVRDADDYAELSRGGPLFNEAGEKVATLYPRLGFVEMDTTLELYQKERVALPLMTALYLSADRSHVWIVTQGESQDQVQKALESLPLYPSMEAAITLLSRR